MLELKSFPFPVLAPDVADYKACCRYEPKIERHAQKGSGATVRHAFYGDGLIGELLMDNQAAFGCIVSLPSTMYRRVDVASEGTMQQHDCIACEQSVPYADSGYGQDTKAAGAIMLRPIILVREEVTKEVTSSHQLLSFLWEEGEKVAIRKGGIIAYGGWAGFGDGGDGMIILERSEDPEVAGWQMHVFEYEGDGFRFYLSAGDRLYNSLKYPSTRADIRQRESVLAHAVSAAFSILKAKYNTPDKYTQHANLRRLAEFLKKKGLPNWCDENFQPEIVATALHPHEFSNKGGEDVS